MYIYVCCIYPFIIPSLQISPFYICPYIYNPCTQTYILGRQYSCVRICIWGIYPSIPLYIDGHRAASYPAAISYQRECGVLSIRGEQKRKEERDMTVCGARTDTGRRSQRAHYLKSSVLLRRTATGPPTPTIFRGSHPTQGFFSNHILLRAVSYQMQRRRSWRPWKHAISLCWHLAATPPGISEKSGNGISKTSFTYTQLTRSCTAEKIFWKLENNGWQSATIMLIY